MKKQSLFNIEYLPLKVTLTFQERAELPPFLGSALRGAIGQALYRTDQEAYAFLYAKGKNSEGKQDIAKPYMVIPPKISIENRVVEAGEELSFEIVLFGSAEKYVDALTKALRRSSKYGLGARRYGFELCRISNGGKQRIHWQEYLFYEAGASGGKKSGQKLSCVTGTIIRLCTPLRIRRGGQLLESISFETLIRNIINRILRLTERYGGWIDIGEAEKIQSLAAGVKTVRENLSIHHLQRYSNRVQDKMDFSGLMGEVEYEGDLTPFVSWLSAAQILHIGRNTTFGMGKIQVYFKLEEKRVSWEEAE